MDIDYIQLTNYLFINKSNLIIMKTKLFTLSFVLIAFTSTLFSQTTRPVMSLTVNHLYVIQSAVDPNLVLTMEPGQAQLKMLPYVADNQWQQWEVYSKTYGTNIRNKYSGYCINDQGNLVPSEPIDGQYLTWQAWDLELSDDAQTVRFCHYLERWTWTGTYYTWAKGSFYTINPTTSKIDILKYDRCLVDGVRDYTGYNASNGLYFSFKVVDVNTLTTVISTQSDDKIRINVQNGLIVLNNISNQNIGIFNLDGKLIKKIKSSDSTVSIPTEKGVYIVKIDNKMHKVIVK